MICNSNRVEEIRMGGGISNDKRRGLIEFESNFNSCRLVNIVKISVNMIVFASFVEVCFLLLLIWIISDKILFLNKSVKIVLSKHNYKSL